MNPLPQQASPQQASPPSATHERREPMAEHSVTMPEQDLIARHRHTLKELFPLPEPGKPQRGSKTPAVIGLLSMVVGALLWLDPAYRTVSLHTEIGGRQTTVLADSSQVTLNTNTRMEVEWHVRSRRVVLHQGQAMFEVSPMQYRPFYVAAGKATVKVVGTVFDVLRKQDDVTVTVLQGKVQVSASQHAGRMQALLLPGQQIVYRAGTLAAPTSVDVASSTAWKDGKLIFERTPLRDVLAEIQRYRSAPILLQNPGLASLQVSGVFDIEHTAALLQLLPKVLPVYVTQKPDGTILVGAR